MTVWLWCLQTPSRVSVEPSGSLHHFLFAAVFSTGGHSYLDFRSLAKTNSLDGYRNSTARRCSWSPEYIIVLVSYCSNAPSQSSFITSRHIFRIRFVYRHVDIARSRSAHAWDFRRRCSDWLRLVVEVIPRRRGVTHIPIPLLVGLSCVQ
ncbi:hypothetical protein BDN67DRAFT_968690 [Paxillus ammoniavirescens]|nr:hypothetical protein BDN67DRAFT_968690 [Paxillus ammoniavirescens]